MPHPKLPHPARLRAWGSCGGAAHAPKNLGWGHVWSILSNTPVVGMKALVAEVI